MNERYEYVARTAYSVVSKYFSFVPNDMVKFCENLGIKIKPLSYYLENGFSKQEFFDFIGNEDGAAASFGGNYYIFYNDFQPSTRMRFTLAEELMHILLGHASDEHFFIGRPYDDDLYKQYENEAKFGASLLLMPPSAYFKYRITYSLQNLAKIFEISEAATYRAAKVYSANEDWLKSIGEFCPICKINVKRREVRGKPKHINGAAL